jgi:hypothetical protein
MHHLASLYQAGADFATSKPDDVLRIQQSLDQVTGMIYARIGLGLGEPYSATLLIHPVSSEEEAMLPPAEGELAPAAAPAVVAPALPQMAVAQVSEPMGEVLQPDLSQLNSRLPSQDLQEETMQVPVSENASQEKVVPVAA